MNTISSSAQISPAAESAKSKRALVLGGGGSTGNAWLIGIVAGLWDAGVDVTKADVIIGTSAGATAAAQLAGATPAELYDAVLSAVPPPRFSRAGGSGGEGGASKPVTTHLERVSSIIASSADAADMRTRLGQAALTMDAASDGAWTERWRGVVASRFPGRGWPQCTLLITAVDARTGEPVVFDHRSGVDLVDAVAASCSSGLPYRIGDNHYIDGGYRSNAENADLAGGGGKILVLSPFGGKTLLPLTWGMHLAAQVDALRAGGSTVETVFPDSGAEHMFGSNAMNASLRPDAARAGHEQGTSIAENIARFWNAPESR